MTSGAVHNGGLEEVSYSDIAWYIEAELNELDETVETEAEDLRAEPDED